MKKNPRNKIAGEIDKKRLQLRGLTQITKWKIEAVSPYNDGWTRQHYQERLDHIRSTLNDNGKLDNHD